MMYRLVIVLVLSVLLLTACGGRMAKPIKTVWSDDELMSCEDIASEVARNKGEIAQLRAEKARRIRRNFDHACMFFCIIPLFELDFNDTQDIEIDAYKTRNQRLEDLARLKQCPTAERKK